MDALFVAVNAKYIHTNNAVRLLHANSTFNTDYIEFTIKDTIDDIVKSILSFHPTIIGFSCYIWNIDIIHEVIMRLKNKTHIPIILGGPEVSYDAANFLNLMPVDIIVKGEGEMVIDDIIRHFIHHEDLDNTPNIAYKVNDTIIDKTIIEIEHLDVIKSPYYNRKDIPHLKNKIAYIEASRGCPYKCSYCLSSLEKKVRFFSLDTIKNDLAYLMTNDVQTFKFLDRTFNANKAMFDILDFIITHHKKGMVFQFEITGDILEERLIDYIHLHAPKGLFRFEIGIQSTHPITNQLVDRIQNQDKLFYNIKKIKRHDIIAMHLDLIAGLPKETLDAFKKTFNDVFMLGASELQLGFLKMLRGTKIRKQASIYDYRFDTNAPYEVKSNKDLSAEDIETIKHVESMLNIFHNKGHFNHFVYDIITAYFSPFEFFNNLYDYVYTHETQMVSYQINDLYQLLDGFLHAKQIPNSELYALKKLYLLRSKVKPKLYFDKVSDKQVKQTVFNALSHRTSFPLHVFYKHSVMIEDNTTYDVVVYKHMTAYHYSIKKANLSG